MNRLFEQLIYSPYTVHVAKEGSDDNGGFAQQCPISLSADAKLTIAGALAVLPVSGGAICVWPGTYDEAVTFPDVPLTLAGYGAVNTKIHPTAADAVAITGGATDGHVLSGVHAKGSTKSAGSPYALYVVGTARINEIYDCIIESQEAGIYAAELASASLSSSRFIMKRCNILAPTNGLECATAYGGDHTVFEDIFIKLLGSATMASFCGMNLRGAAGKPYPSWYMKNVMIGTDTDAEFETVSGSLLDNYYGYLLADNLVLDLTDHNPAIDMTHSLYRGLSFGKALFRSCAFSSNVAEPNGTINDILATVNNAFVGLQNCYYKPARVTVVEGGLSTSPVADVNGLVDVSLIGGQTPMTVNDLMNADLSGYNLSGTLPRYLKIASSRR